MTMQDAIADILSKIEKGCIFDSHYIITQLIKYYSDVYLEYACGIKFSTNKTLSVHGHIGQEIANFESTSDELQIQIRRLDNMSWSENIHGNSSKCTAWVKL